MANRLITNALRGVDEQDSHVCLARSDGHVAGVLLVSRRVGEDCPTPRRQIHVAVSNVNRDALFTFGLKTVGQLRKVDLSVGKAARVVDFVKRDRVGLNEQATENGRLTVVDGATNNDTNECVGH